MRDLEALVRRLGQQADPDNRATYLSLYADLSDPGHSRVLDQRRSSIEEALPEGVEQTAFEEAWTQAHDALEGLDQDGNRGAAVFAHLVEGELEARGLAQPVETRAVLDSSPYVRPLARFLDHYEPFLLVALDGERGEVHRIEAAQPGEEETVEADLQGRHGKGGMSQMRFQRKRREAEKRFYDQLVEHIEQAWEEEPAVGLVIVGPGQAKRELENRLPDRLREALLAMESAELEGALDREMVDRWVEAVEEESRQRDAADVEALWRGLRRGWGAQVGALSVARAARDGRVETLLYVEQAQAVGEKCERHDTLFERGGACHCGASGNEVDLVEEAVEYTLRADGEVEVLDEAPRLADVGGVGALLRW